MRVRRLLSVVALAAVAASVLTACQTHTGAAAFVGSSRISESEVNQYVSPNATDYTEPNSSGSALDTINPKSSVLSLLIADKLFAALFKKVPGGVPSAGTLAAARSAVLTDNGVTTAQLTQELVKDGYSASYIPLFVNVHADFTLLSTAVGDAGDGAKLLPAIAKLNLRVRVSPRYGDWMSNELALTNGPDTPSFLQLTSTAADTAAAGGA